MANSFATIRTSKVLTSLPKDHGFRGGRMLQKYSQTFPNQLFWCYGVEVLGIWIPKEGLHEQHQAQSRGV